MTFGSTHKVLKAEKVLKEKELKFRLNPAPKFIKRIKPRCSLVITIEETVLDVCMDELSNEKILPVSVYKETGNKVKFDGVEEDEYEEWIE